MVKRFPLWIFGLEPKDIGDYLSKHSLHLIEDIGSEQMRERYMKPANLGLTVFDIERIAMAEVKN